MNELLYQALETEIGGEKVYKTAIQCAQNPELKEEWQKYLDETEKHERILRERVREARSRPGDGDARTRRSCATTASRS